MHEILQKTFASLNFGAFLRSILIVKTIYFKIHQEIFLQIDFFYFKNNTLILQQDCTTDKSRLEFFSTKNIKFC